MRRFLKTRHYLDWAAAAPVRPDALAVFRKAVPVFANPSALHEEGAAAYALLEEARGRIAACCAAKPHAVIFTSGATEANTLAVMGRARRLRHEGIAYEHMHALVLPTAHASTRRTMERLARLGATVEELPVVDRAIDLERVRKMLRPETMIVSCDAAESETGIRYDTRALARVVQATAPGAVVHVDASQLPLVESVERTRLGADLLVLGAQKVGGIRGVGALVASVPGAIVGTGEDGQEGGLRPGTEPVALAVAFAEVLEAVGRERSAFSARAADERVRCIANLRTAIPDLRIIEGPTQLPHLLSIAVPGMDAEYAVHLLDAVGYAVSARSACESAAETPSRAITLATGDPSLARSALRISWGPTTPTRALEKFPRVLARILPLARSSE